MQAISENQKAVERIRDAYFEALDGMMAKKETSSEGEEVYSIQYTKDNVPFVVTERDILDGVPEKDWVKTVKENLRGKFPNGVQIGKNTIKINQNSRRELTFSEYMKEVFRNDKTAYADKLRVTDNADEIVRASRNYVNEALHHERKDNIAQFARGNVLLRVGNNDYSADVIVGTKNNSDMLLYDIINLNKTTIEERNKKQAQLTSQHKNATSRSAVPAGTITQPTAKSNSDPQI